MMKHALMALAVVGAVSACTTVNEKTIEYCDTDSRQFIGITITRQANCIGISNSESGNEITIPPGVGDS